MKNGILKEQDYQEQMEHVVEPYLHSKERELWLEREHGKQIYVRCYQAKKARGVVLISHGFTETSEKYKELIYYFLRGGYHVYIPEHCGHGRSYRLVEDPSLVHVDSYKRYVAGQKPYSGPRRFENSSSTSRVRYEYYRAKKEKEPLFQMNAASYGWLHAAACLNRDLQRDGVRRIRIPVILFQSEHDHLVSKKEQVRFILKLNQNGNTYAKLVRVPGTRHEIWGADEKILRGYLGMIFRFLSGQK